MWIRFELLLLTLVSFLLAMHCFQDAMFDGSNLWKVINVVTGFLSAIIFITSTIAIFVLSKDSETIVIA